VGGPHSLEWYGTAWTGAKMIVWGGSGANGYLDVGAAYDPATDTWEELATEGSPPGRLLVDPVWTGSEMIVWGGVEAGEQLVNTGGRYDPATDTWSATSTSGAPTPRFRNVAVWTGSEMIVWGGMVTPPWTRLDSGGRYDPATDTWMPMSMTNAPEARDDFTAVWTGSEMIVWGGYVGTDWSTATNTGGRYDPVTDVWTPTSTVGAPPARAFHEAIWTGSEMIVWGGSETGIGEAVNTGASYDPATDTWTSLTANDSLSGRYLHNAVWTGSEMIVWGGDDSGDYTAFDTGGRYDPLRSSWQSLASGAPLLATPHHTAVWTGSEMIVWGREAGTLSFVGARYLP
jgi:N-acetylneuraminic acid mutarotase